MFSSSSQLSRLHCTFTGILFVHRTIITQRVTLVKPSAISHTISPIPRRQPEETTPFTILSSGMEQRRRQPVRAEMSKVDGDKTGGKVFAEFYQMKRLNLPV